jgi:glucose-1-phosphate cytidylyltransferase
MTFPVVILCGGKGTRIRDVADDIPKPMIPIGDRPILWHIMKGFAQHGFKRFILCLGYKSWIIKQYFLNYLLAGADVTVRLSAPDSLALRVATAPEDWQITLAETGLESMTGHRVKRIADYLEAPHFLLTYGDGVADVDVSDLVRYHLEHGRIGTVTAVHPPSRFGEMQLQGSRVVAFHEKPRVTHTRINGGFFVFQRRFLERLDDDPGLVLEQEPLARLAHDDELRAYCHDGFWQCMDSSRDFHLLNDLWARGIAPWDTWSVGPFQALETVRPAA